MNNNMRIQIRLTQKDFVALTLKGVEKRKQGSHFMRILFRTAQI